MVAISQTVGRVQINGKIIVEDSDVEGITIFNTSSNKGEATDENGKFKIKAKLNDNLEVRALQYQNFDIKVTQAMIDSRRIRVFLIEEINKLPEVLVLTSSLSGNLGTDVEKVKTFNPKLDALYFGIKKQDEYEFSDDYRSEVTNEAVHSQVPQMVNGLNIVNVVDQLLLPLFRSNAKVQEGVEMPPVPNAAIKYYMGSNFLVDNFGIPEHRVEEFIQYVEDENFDFNLLNYGNEMDFLEILNKKSKTFLNQASEKK
jgi:hypothetical protein